MGYLKHQNTPQIQQITRSIPLDIQKERYKFIKLDKNLNIYRESHWIYEIMKINYLHILHRQPQQQKKQ